jgi:NitT/TauT family transport system ATP-binding protein
VSFTCHQITKEYGTDDDSIAALKDLSLSAANGEFLCIVGPSGCGKSTLLKIIAGLVEPNSGSITFDPAPDLGKQHTAMVFQEQGLFPWMTVLDNVAFPLEMAGIAKAQRHTEALEFIEKIGLRGFANRYPYELSGGMRQRVAIARAFLANPQILLMDEPFGVLDAQTRLVLQTELVSLWNAHPKIVIYVTHDIEEAVLLGDRIIVMTGRPGRIREELTVPLARPRDLVRSDDKAISEIKWHIWKMLEDEVLDDLQQIRHAP